MGLRRSYLLLLLLFPLSLFSQDLTNLRSLQIDTGNDTLFLDSLSVIPGTLHLVNAGNELIPDSLYSLDPFKSLLVIDSALMKQTGITAGFRVFPMKFDASYENKNRDWIQPGEIDLRKPFVTQGGRQGNQADPFMTEGLSKSGSISRGVYFGNGQDFSVNSNLNLQLSGRLGQDVDILAAISDSYVPLQPYGNTQVIQEFDKVFIQLSTKQSRLVAGDFELSRPPGYFLNFYKKLQGGDFSTSFGGRNRESGGQAMKYSVRTSAALSKGKYARNNVKGIEGNQGPYYLTGNEGETFIIVLAGTERVFIDGKPLVRGEQMDYVIDYNAAVLTFTPNVMITKDSRIEVEFEYSDKTYARSLFYVTTGFEFRNLKMNVNLYSEQDLKNQPLQLDLSEEDRNMLTMAGGDITGAYIPWYDSIGYNTDEILYRMSDSISDGLFYDSIFVYSRNPDSAFYRVGFTNVGENQGDYVLQSTLANGRIFRWVAPENGVPQGSYKPVRLVVTPKKSQMATVNIAFDPDSNSSVYAEYAVSNYNANTFSGGEGNRSGMAFKTMMKKDFPFQTGWKFTTLAEYELTGINFRPVERFRQVEFTRDWNITDTLPASDQHLVTAGAGVGKATLGSLNYSFQGFFVGEGYEGFRNVLLIQMKKRGYELILNGNLLNTSQAASNTVFLRQNGSLVKYFRTFSIGLRQEMENNRQYNNVTDSLKSPSFSYLQWETFLQTPDTSKTLFRLSFRQREDRNPSNNTLKLSARARVVEGSFGYLKNAAHRFTIGASYRDLQIIDTLINPEEPGQTILGRVEHYIRILKGVFIFNTYYEVGSGSDMKIEYYYLKVPAGEGVYAWNDYNGDGIEQLDEFEPAAFKDQALYIRVYVKSNDFVRTYTGKFTESLSIQPAAAWKAEKGWKGVVGRFSDQLIYRIEKKSSQDNPWLAFNPFGSEGMNNDSLLIGLNSSFRNTLYYDRASPKLSADFSFLTNRVNNLLVTGIESRTQQNSELNLRWNFYKPMTLVLTFSNGSSSRGSELSSASNYQTGYYELKPALSFLPGPSLRIDMTYTFSEREGLSGEDKTASSNNDLGAEINLRFVNKGSILFKANYLSINYDGDENTPMAYELLKGFKNGRNGIWSLSWQQNLARFLQLNITYEGRKSGDNNAIHTGNIQLRAHF